MNLPSEVLSELLVKMADIEYRLTSGTPENLQLSALVGAFHLARTRIDMTQVAAWATTLRLMSNLLDFSNGMVNISVHPAQTGLILLKPILFNGIITLPVLNKYLLFTHVICLGYKLLW